MIWNLAFLWMSGAGNVWARPVRQECVFHINTGLFLSTGDGWETEGGGGGCHSYHLTHDLLQTQVDVDTLQILVRQSDLEVFKCSHWLSFVPCIFWRIAALTFPVVTIFIRSNINPPLYLRRLFKAVDSPRVFCVWSNGSGAAWIYRPPFCRLRTDRSRSEIDNTCRPAVQPASLRSDETAAFIFSRVWAGLPLTGSHRKLFVLCKWWLMTRLAKPAVFDKKYWWPLSVKC